MTKRARLSPGDKDAKKKAAQRKAQARIDRERDSSKRLICRLLMFWRLCEQTPCRRARDCVCDPHACFERRWPRFTELERIWMRSWLTGVCNGLKPAQAAGTADAEVKRCQELEVRLAATYPAETRGGLVQAAAEATARKHPAAEVQKPAPHMPRIRVL